MATAVDGGIPGVCFGNPCVSADIFPTQEGHSQILAGQIHLLLNIHHRVGGLKLTDRAAQLLGRLVGTDDTHAPGLG